MTEKVLLVDDDPNLLAGLKRQLRKQFRIDTALGGEEGLEAIEDEGPFAVVVSDLRMPSMDGIEFLTRVARQAPDIVRMMLTGYADLETAIMAVSEGGLFRFLTKPCPADRLAESLRAGVEEYGSIAAERAALSTASDAASRGRLAERLLQSQKMEVLGRIAGGVAHDFRNLLVAITGYASLAQEKLRPDALAHEWIGQVLDAAKRASRLTERLLYFSRRRSRIRQVAGLNDLVGDLDKMLRYLIGRRIELEMIPGEDLGLVEVDPGQIDQVVVNLVVNARDAMPDGGRLTLATSNARLDGEHGGQHLGITPGEYVVLAVSDTGTGMTDAVKERLFEPFFTTKGPGEGTGLGLTTVRDIVRQHAGSIEVESRAGAGTTFKIYLPRIEEPADGTPM